MIRSFDTIEDKDDDAIADEANQEIIKEIERVIIYVDADDWRRKVCADSYNLAYLKTSSIVDAAVMLDALGVFWST